MKRFISLLLAAAVLAGCMSGCAAAPTGSDHPSETTAAVPETTAPDMQKPVDPPEEYIPLNSEFPTGTFFDYPTVLETEHMTIRVDENIYVPDYTGAYLEKIYSALEMVSGLSFFGKMDDSKVVIHVMRASEDYLLPGLPDDTEIGPAYTTPYEVVVGPLDLLLGKSDALAHEMSHMLMFRQIPDLPCPLLSEGFAEYNAYKAQLYLEQTAPEVAWALDDSGHHLVNMDITPAIALYNQPLSVWIEEGFPFEYAGNGHYAVGFRFMSYLDHVYGDYASWIATATPDGGDLQNMDAVYGAGTSDGFYDWMRGNEALFSWDMYSEYPTVLTGCFVLYPNFDAGSNETAFSSIMLYAKEEYAARGEIKRYYTFCYRDAAFGIDEYRHFLTDYKGYASDGIRLTALCDTTVSFYAADGVLLAREQNPLDYPLEGVSYIQLDGEGTCCCLVIDGYEIYDLYAQP